MRVKQDETRASWEREKIGKQERKKERERGRRE